MAGSPKYFWGRWNQWATCREIRLRILSKYFLPFKEKIDHSDPLRFEEMRCISSRFISFIDSSSSPSFALVLLTRICQKEFLFPSGPPPKSKRILKSGGNQSSTY